MIKLVDGFTVPTPSSQVPTTPLIGVAGSAGHEFALILARNSMYFWQNLLVFNNWFEFFLFSQLFRFIEFGFKKQTLIELKEKEKKNMKMHKKNEINKNKKYVNKIKKKPKTLKN